MTERAEKPRRPAAHLDNDLPCALFGRAHAQCRAFEGVSMSHVDLHLTVGRVRGRQSSRTTMALTPSALEILLLGGVEPHLCGRCPLGGPDGIVTEDLSPTEENHLQ